MYGTIAQWEKVNASDFTKAVDEALKTKPKEVVFPTHSPGGDIGEGIAMGNKVRQLRNMGIKTICRVDGMAASMASVFASCCDETEVTPFSRMMVHEGRGGVYGTAKQMRERANLLESFNKDLASIYAEKTGKDEKWILDNWMAEGRDSWFTAQEAIDAKLADRKVGAVVKQLPRLAAMNDWNAMAASYDPFFKENNSTESEIMKKEQLIALLGLKADATEAEIEAAIKEAKAKADATTSDPTGKQAQSSAAPPTQQDGSGATASDKDQVIEGIVALAKERGMEAKQIEAVKKLAAVDVKAAMDMIPAKAEAETKTVSITELIASINKGGSGKESENRKDWKYSEWQKKDSVGLLAMANEKPDEFAKLFAAEYGYTPSVEEIKKLIA